MKKNKKLVSPNYFICNIFVCNLLFFLLMIQSKFVQFYYLYRKIYLYRLANIEWVSLSQFFENNLLIVSGIILFFLIFDRLFYFIRLKQNTLYSNFIITIYILDFVLYFFFSLYVYMVIISPVIDLFNDPRVDIFYRFIII